MSYDKVTMTDFQRLIRLGKDELLSAAQKPKPSEHILYDHCPLKSKTIINMFVGSLRKMDKI